MKNSTEVVIINWKRPKNVARIIDSLVNQTIPNTITVCDCHPSPKFALTNETLLKANRVYRWAHNLGAFSRFLPLPALDHEYTFFIDDDLLPGQRCLEYFLDCSVKVNEFGVLGQLGRIIDMDGIYRPKDIERTSDFIESDFIVRAYFTKTKHLHNLLKFRWYLNYFDQELPEDDLLLCAALKYYENLPCYILPASADTETLINKEELSTEFALSKRIDHRNKRKEFVRRLIENGWSAVNSFEKRCVSSISL